MWAVSWTKLLELWNEAKLTKPGFELTTSLVVQIEQALLPVWHRAFLFSGESKALSSEQLYTRNEKLDQALHGADLDERNEKNREIYHDVQLMYNHSLVGENIFNNSIRLLFWRGLNHCTYWLLKNIPNNVFFFIIHKTKH